MNYLSISQAYMLCVLNEHGKLPMVSADLPIAILTGGILDLMLEDCAQVRERKLYLKAPLPDALSHLHPLYQFLAEHDAIKLEDIASQYYFSFTGKKLTQLLSCIGHSLANEGCVTPEMGGMTGKKELFVPVPSAVDNVVQYIRAELLEDGALSDDIVSLTALLARSNMLKRYFSSYERNALKSRMKEIKTSPQHKSICELLDYVEGMMVAIIVAAT